MCSVNSTSDYGVRSIGKSFIQYALTIVVPGRIFLNLLQGPEIAQVAEELARVVLVIVFREVRLQCLFLTCCRRKVDQLYCPEYWEFTKHVKCSGDFLCTINPLNAELNPICHLLALLGVHFLHVSRIRVNDLDFVVFVLYYMVLLNLVVN